MNHCPNTKCGAPDKVRIEIGVSDCFVVCDGCGMCGPTVAPGDWGSTTDAERKQLAEGLWDLLPRIVETFPDRDADTQPGHAIPEGL